LNFYSVIIGTELLNGRRTDAHFPFLNSELLKRGWTHKASFVIKDEPEFINSVFRLVKNDPQSVMFCFGGIGATPDDYTRKCAADIFTDGITEVNSGAKEAILARFGDDAYPHRINMATLPINSGLLKNIISNVPGFYVQNRFFFMPGFPSMSQHMIIEALEKFYPQNSEKTFRLTLSAWVSENDLVDTMTSISDQADMSSLPIIEGDSRYTVISISSNSEELTKNEFAKFVTYCENHKIKYILEDIKGISEK